MFADVSWTCKKCKKVNITECDCYDEEEERFEVECANCDEKQWIRVKFSVTAECVEVLDKEDMRIYHEKEMEEFRRKHTVKCEISRDNGKTWETIDLFIYDTDPETSVLKVGDLIKSPSQGWIMRVEQTVDLGGRPRLTAVRV